MLEIYRPRPVTGYSDQGSSSAGTGIRADECPYPAGTLAAADWLLGYREQDLADYGVVAMDGLDDEVEMHRRNADRSYARSARWRLLETVRADLPDVDLVAAAIGLPASKWPMNCYAVATMIVEAGMLSGLEQVHGGARACYGMYDGPVAHGTPFHRRSLVRHGWIEFADGLVVDPTRFVFEGSAPYLWAGSVDEYDLGANRLRQGMRKPAPAFSAQARQFRWVANDPAVTDVVGRLLGDLEGLRGRRTLSDAQAFWLANQPPEILGEATPEIYRALDQAGCGGLVPTDNRQHAASASPSFA